MRRRVYTSLPSWFRAQVFAHLTPHQRGQVLDGECLGPAVLLHHLSPRPPLARFDNRFGSLWLFVGAEGADVSVVYLCSDAAGSYNHIPPPLPIPVVQDAGKTLREWGRREKWASLDACLYETAKLVYRFLEETDGQSVWNYSESPINDGWLQVAAMVAASPREDLQQVKTLIALGAYPGVRRGLDEFPGAFTTIIKACTFYGDTWTDVVLGADLLPAVTERSRASC